MRQVDTVLVVKPPEPQSLPGQRSSRELGPGVVLLLFMIRVEALQLAAERPGLVEEFARGGAARDFLRFSCGAQALVEGPDGGVVAGGAERGHVQCRAQPAVAVVADGRSAADAAPRLTRHRGQPGV